MKRRLEEIFFKALMLISAAIVIGGLLLLLVMVTLKGIQALSWDMLTKVPDGGFYMGREGGVLNAITGSLLLALGATVPAGLLALPLVLFLQPEYGGHTRLAGLVRICLDLLWGIPSIVYGAFGFAIMVAFGIRASLLGGIIALTLVEFPIMARAMEEVVRMVPVRLKEAAWSMGATRWETMRHVVLKQALPGLVTATLLGFGRGIGDAAAVLFTAGYTDNLPRTLMDPVASLPLAVFFQLGTPFPEVQARAHASALILLIIVLLISIFSRVAAVCLSRFRVR